MGQNKTLKIGILGCSGLGKSAIGTSLSESLNIPFLSSKDITRPILKKFDYRYSENDYVEYFLSRKEIEFELVRADENSTASGNESTAGGNSGTSSGTSGTDSSSEEEEERPVSGASSGSQASGGSGGGSTSSGSSGTGSSSGGSSESSSSSDSGTAGSGTTGSSTAGNSTVGE